MKITIDCEACNSSFLVEAYEDSTAHDGYRGPPTPVEDAPKLCEDCIADKLAAADAVIAECAANPERPFHAYVATPWRDPNACGFTDALPAMPINPNHGRRC